MTNKRKVLSVENSDDTTAVKIPKLGKFTLKYKYLLIPNLLIIIEFFRFFSVIIDINSIK